MTKTVEQLEAELVVAQETIAKLLDVKTDVGVSQIYDRGRGDYMRKFGYAFNAAWHESGLAAVYDAGVAKGLRERK